MSRALRLHEKHTKTELLALAEEVKADPANRNGGFYLYTTKTRKLLEDIQWAIYWHQAPNGNGCIHRAAPQTKYW